MLCNSRFLWLFQMVCKTRQKRRQVGSQMMSATAQTFMRALEASWSDGESLRL